MKKLPFAILKFLPIAVLLLCVSACQPNGKNRHSFDLKTPDGKVTPVSITAGAVLQVTIDSVRYGLRLKEESGNIVNFELVGIDIAEDTASGTVTISSSTIASQRLSPGKGGNLMSPLGSIGVSYTALAPDRGSIPDCGNPEICCIYISRDEGERKILCCGSCDLDGIGSECSFCLLKPWPFPEVSPGSNAPEQPTIADFIRSNRTHKLYTR